MKHIKLFEAFNAGAIDHKNLAMNDKFKTDIIKVATPEQKVVLNDFESGTEYLFFGMMQRPGTKITPETIDDMLVLMVNDVEGDESQLEPEHVKYAKKKGWFDGFNESHEKDTFNVMFDRLEGMFAENIGKKCVFKFKEMGTPLEEKGILRKNDKGTMYTVDSVWYEIAWMRDMFERGSLKNLTVSDNNIKYSIDGDPYDLTFDVK